jgi:hypothetical protein
MTLLSYIVISERLQATLSPADKHSGKSIHMYRVLLACAVLLSSTTLAAQGPSTSKPSVRPVPRSVVPRVLGGTGEKAFATIQGGALSATSAAQPDSPVRLRDARLGRIVETQRTDRSGLFAFRAVDPGSYVVELLSNDQRVLAASQVLHVNAGETITAVVRLPFRDAPLKGLLGHSTPQIATIVSAAAASGVLATQVTADAASPQ